jgi:hypothetical protein
VVGGPVGPSLERADVTGRATVHAPHVRVQDHSNGIPRTRVGATLQGSLPVLHLHRTSMNIRSLSSEWSLYSPN